MSTFPTLPTDPLPHLAMDYVRLRAEGLRLLGRLAGQQWTDFNTHDPGITILEQLCYAITDLGYRINYPMADLLAGSSAPGLPGPAEILTGDPVTRADLRKLVLDIAGIGNAWVEDPGEPALPFYHHPGSGELRLQPNIGDVDARPVRLRGLHRVLLQTTGEAPGDTFDQVAARLHRSRLLGEDFELARLESYKVSLRASIEVGPIDDPVAVLADVIERIESYLAPPARFVTLADARARGRRIDELFEGPLLDHGFVDDLPAPRRTVYVSDLIHAIMDVPQVRAVRSISLAGSSTASIEPWALAIPAGHAATLDPGSELTLLRAGLPLRDLREDARDRLEHRRVARTLVASDTRELQAPAGRDRSLARHQSIQRQLPAAYGIGPLGLPASAAARRRAQARQLEAYLLIFDQLLANAFAQLAHAHELLSPNEGGTRTYFAQPVEDHLLRLHELISPDADRAWLDDAVEPGDSLERRKRFLNHLLARFAEHLGDHSLIGSPTDRVRDSKPDPKDLALVEDRQAFLRHYPRLSGARGSGCDLRDESLSPSGLEERLRLKLGLPEHLRFHLVEHILLRPLAEDRYQRDPNGEEPVPLLASVAGPDPWSLQVSFVFEASSPRDLDFESFVAQTILAETPAHLTVHLHWFDSEGDTSWEVFEAAWTEFRAHHRAYRWPVSTGQPSDAARLQLLQLRARDARDRVIDLLGIGRTYPLRDLPLPRRLVVNPGAATAITLGFSQRGVIYELWGEDDKPILLDGKPITAERISETDETLVLPTPPIDVDVTYRILAVKRESADKPDEPGERREAWLHGAVRIEEGVDPSLVIHFVDDLPLLDTRIDARKPSDARIVDYGAEVRVAVVASQEGVDYVLIDDANFDRAVSQNVVGTSGTIELKLDDVTEDIDLRVRGSKTLGDPQKPELRTAVLDAVLRLRVRANPAVTAELVPAIVAHGDSTIVELGETQQSASYRVWQRRIRDREIVFEQSPAFATIDVADGARTIHVQRPEQPAVWQDLPDFTPCGDARHGTGGRLEIALDRFDEDAVLLVQAIKQHRNGLLSSDAETIASAVQLDRALALLVRPNHGQALRVLATLAGDATQGPVQVRDGQDGVYYELRLAGADTAIDRPVYFHQRDDMDKDFNKGVDQLRVEVDLAIARDAEGQADLRSRTAPPPPMLDAELAPGTALHVLARKAMTGLEAELDHTVIVEEASE
jgi:hypothetical protein